MNFDGIKIDFGKSKARFPLAQGKELERRNRTIEAQTRSPEVGGKAEEKTRRKEKTKWESVNSLGGPHVIRFGRIPDGPSSPVFSTVWVALKKMQYSA